MMKRFTCLFLGLSLFTFTGCPPQPTSAPAGGSGSKPIISSGTTSPEPKIEAAAKLGVDSPKPEEPKIEIPKTETPKPDVAKEVGEAVKETKEAVVAVAETAVEKAKETAEKTAEVVKETAEKVVEKAEAVIAGGEKVVDKLLGDATGKPKEILDIIKGYKNKRAFDAEKNAARKPKVHTLLAAEFFNPDGMTVNDKTGTLFLSIPNFSRRPNDSGAKIHPAVLLKVNLDGTVEKVLTFEAIEGIQVETKQIGPMGLDFGPDGNLYVCDNQYFFDTKNKSRILRVLMDGDKPTGKIEVVVEGIKLANAILWQEDKLLLTDTFLDLEGQFGSGCVWKFSKDEILKAGSGENPPIKLNPLKKAEDDSHCVTIQTVKKVPGGGNGGADGMTADSNGVVYFGNFGNGELYRLVFDAEGKGTVEVIHPAGEYFNCCDGIYYDKGTNKVYVTDSAGNAVHAFVPPQAGEKAVLETIWENANTNGADGSLDQPCEAVVVGKKLILVNFDWPFPELLNTASDDPSTLSVIELE
jgi:sugar lactone lactonase YvrE